MPRHRPAALVALALAPVLLCLTACSQIAALAPVSGARETEVRYAAIDILMRHDIQLLAAPDCEPPDDDETIRCAGETLSGVDIIAVSTGAAPTQVTVTVGDVTLYSGEITPVLQEAMER